VVKHRQLGQRIGTLLLAVLFLLTSVGFSVLVIWQINQDSKKSAEEEALQQALTQQQAAQAPTEEPQEGQLQGTKLQNFTPGADITTVRVEDVVVGTGVEVKPGDTITAHYTGALASDGTIFQSSLDTGQPFTSPLSGLIQGWQEGIPGMKEGGKRRLYIPAEKAYGATERTGIPANSDLVFDIELIKVGE
jgi:FKBP-type peptidyl-prolyl cis-trans isomerase